MNRTDASVSIQAMIDTYKILKDHGVSTEIPMDDEDLESLKFALSNLSTREKGEWIPFSEKQPEDGQEVIATVIADESKNLPKRVIMDCFIATDLEWWQNNVTGWMPKPKAYESPCEEEKNA